MTARVTAFALAAAFIALAPFAAPADACEMCPRSASVGAVEAAASATLVAIVSRADEQPPQDERLPTDQPDTIALEVHQVLAGEAEGTIVANSWEGMCDYGIVIAEGDESHYLVMLEKRGDEWRQAARGCAPYQLKVVDGAVKVPQGVGFGKYFDETATYDTVPVAELAAALGLDGDGSDENEGEDEDDDAKP